MTRSPELAIFESESGSAAVEFVMLVAPIGLSFGLALNLFLASHARVEALMLASATAQKLAAADANSWQDAPELEELSASLKFANLKTQTVTATEGTIQVCYDYSDAWGESQVCWHSVLEPR